MFRKNLEKNITEEHHSRIGSTQDRAKELVAKLTPSSCFVVTADEQTKGRGTHGRLWLSPPKVNIYTTIVLPFPHTEKHLLVHIPQIVAYSVLQTIGTLGIQAKFKWVNDVLINKKKVCGILCENEQPTHLKNNSAVLIGIGVNVNQDQASCDSLDQPVTSLMLELGKNVNVKALTATLTECVLENIDKLVSEGFGSFCTHISENMEFAGETVRIQLDDEQHTIKEGILMGLDDGGRLLLKVDKQIETLTEGSLLRPKF